MLTVRRHSLPASNRMAKDNAGLQYSETRLPKVKASSAGALELARMTRSPARRQRGAFRYVFAIST